jgi:hypothetical protein
MDWVHNDNTFTDIKAKPSTADLAGSKLTWAEAVALFLC